VAPIAGMVATSTGSPAKSRHGIEPAPISSRDDIDPWGRDRAQDRAGDRGRDLTRENGSIAGRHREVRGVSRRRRHGNASAIEIVAGIETIVIGAARRPDGLIFDGLDRAGYLSASRLTRSSKFSNPPRASTSRLLNK